MRSPSATWSIAQCARSLTFPVSARGKCDHGAKHLMKTQWRLKELNSKSFDISWLGAADANALGVLRRASWMATSRISSPYYSSARSDGNNFSHFTAPVSSVRYQTKPWARCLRWKGDAIAESTSRTNSQDAKYRSDNSRSFSEDIPRRSPLNADADHTAAKYSIPSRYRFHYDGTACAATRRHIRSDGDTF